MRFTSICLAFLLPVAFASSIPQVVQDGVDQVRFTFSDDNDPCPDFLVRCIKDSEVVGDVSSLSFPTYSPPRRTCLFRLFPFVVLIKLIPLPQIGNKGMERKGLKCVQKHHKINTLVPLPRPHRLYYDFARY